MAEYACKYCDKTGFWELYDGTFECKSCIDEKRIGRIEREKLKKQNRSKSGATYPQG